MGSFADAKRWDYIYLRYARVEGHKEGEAMQSRGNV